MNYLDIGDILAIRHCLNFKQKNLIDYKTIYLATCFPKASFFGREVFSNIWSKAAVLFHFLIKNKPFGEDSKNAAFFSTMRFLQINGYDLTVSAKGIESFVLDAYNRNLEEIAFWLKKHSQPI